MLPEHDPIFGILMAKLDIEPQPEDLHPLRTAEQVGFFALAELGGWNGNIQAIRELRGMNKAWNLAELGLSSREVETSEGFFDTAEMRFQKNMQTTSVSNYIRAAMGYAAIPTLRMRAQHQAVPLEARARSYYRISEALGIATLSPKLQCPMDGEPISEETSMSIKKAHGSLVEGLTYAMLLRGSNDDLAPFPAAPREDKSQLAYMQLNHDLYVIRDGQKIPIQVKRNEEDELGHQRLENGIVTIVLNPIIAKEIRSLRDHIRAESGNTSWYVHYRNMARPDTFLAHCLVPQLHPAFSEYTQTAARLVQNVSNAVVETVNKQINEIYPPETDDTTIAK